MNKRGLLILFCFLIVISISFSSASLCTSKGYKCIKNINVSPAAVCQLADLNYAGNRTLDFSCDDSGLTMCCKKLSAKKTFYCLNPIMFDGEGITTGPKTYTLPYEKIFWAFQPDLNATLKPCEWRCYKKGYEKDSLASRCVKI
ncbi:MAG: hypothetical protein Q7S33_04300 [Nanoarchaeota archaeon]|nr:hypothetical protein [Nanoarchaeota archaeon]